MAERLTVITTVYPAPRQQEIDAHYPTFRGWVGSVPEFAQRTVSTNITDLYWQSCQVGKKQPSKVKAGPETVTNAAHVKILLQSTATRSAHFHPELLQVGSTLQVISSQKLSETKFGSGSNAIIRGISDFLLS